MSSNNPLFKRKIESQINDWKQSLSVIRKTLIIMGLRQVGKTSIVKKYAEDHYDNVVYIPLFTLNTNIFK